MERADVVVVGAGAAGLMAAITAGRQSPGARIVALDGARRLGAKILIAGGGRCNVTHDVVDETGFAGGSRAAIRKVLGRFDVGRTVAFFREIGVELVREETGKLFPSTNRARTVLDALVGAARSAGVEIRWPWRVASLEPSDGGLVAAGPAGRILGARTILTTGGRSVPETGSDGHGYELARRLGHATTPRIFPALVPLLLPPGHPYTRLRGVSAPAALTVEDGRGHALVRFEGPVLLTHFGLSGPAVLDVSRWWIDAREDDPAARLVASWLPGETAPSVERWLAEGGGDRLLSRLQTRLPRRLAEALLAEAGVGPDQRSANLPREGRRRLAGALVASALPVVGPRGWAYAEATAGGVPLGEVHLDRMESRVRPGLFLAGEILDVDGRIGGFNFQWAWSSGWVAGGAAAASAAGAGPQSVA